MIVGVVASAALLSGTTVATAAAATQPGLDGAEASAIEQQSSAKATSAINAVDVVRGELTYTQDAITSNSDISRVFVKAATSLCASLPEYAVSQAASIRDIAVSTPEGTVVYGNVQEAAGEAEEVAKILGCSCASNVAGGGAVANAEVSGVSLETLAAAAGV